MNNNNLHNTHLIYLLHGLLSYQNGRLWCDTSFNFSFDIWEKRYWKCNYKDQRNEIGRIPKAQHKILKLCAMHLETNKR